MAKLMVSAWVSTSSVSVSVSVSSETNSFCDRKNVDRLTNDADDENSNRRENDATTRADGEEGTWLFSKRAKAPPSRNSIFRSFFVLLGAFFFPLPGNLPAHTPHPARRCPRGPTHPLPLAIMDTEEKTGKSAIINEVKPLKLVARARPAAGAGPRPLVAAGLGLGACAARFRRFQTSSSAFFGRPFSSSSSSVAAEPRSGGRGLPTEATKEASLSF